jgi:hypothetical protein
MIFSLRFASMFLASENKPDPLPKTLPSTGFQTKISKKNKQKELSKKRRLNIAVFIH